MLCETVKDFVAKVAETARSHDGNEESIATKCATLNEKLDALLKTLQQESGDEQVSKTMYSLRYVAKLKKFQTSKKKLEVGGWVLGHFG